MIILDLLHSGILDMCLEDSYLLFLVHTLPEHKEPPLDLMEKSPGLEITDLEPLSAGTQW